MMRPPELIIRNSIRCLKCGDEIVSAHRHDFRFCRCGAVGVDGGQTWVRRLGEFHHWTDTSVIATCEENDEAAVAETGALLEGVRQGVPMQPQNLRDAPALEAWRIVRMPPKRVIVGVVSDHPDFEDGVLLATTGVVALKIEEGWARTTRRFYRLGGRQQ